METTDLKHKIPPSLSLKANKYLFLNEYLQIWIQLHLETKHVRLVISIHVSMSVIIRTQWQGVSL